MNSHPAQWSFAAAAITLATAGTAHASPSAWAPTSIEQSVKANCDGVEAEVSYVSSPRPTEQPAFSITGLMVGGPSQSEETRIELDGLPGEIGEIARPFVERVIPMCTEREGVSFVFYLTSQDDMLLPRFISQGKVHRLYIDVARDGDVNVYAKELG